MENQQPIHNQVAPIQGEPIEVKDPRDILQTEPLTEEERIRQETQNQYKVAVAIDRMVSDARLPLDTPTTTSSPKASINLQKGYLQPWYEKLGNGLVQGLIGEAIGGSAIGFGALGEIPDMIANQKEAGYMFNNALMELGSDLMTDLQRSFPIYRRNPEKAFDLSDWAGWFGQSIPSLLSTVGMALPAGAVVKGISGLGKVLGMSAKASTAAQKFAVAGRVLGHAALSRHMENVRGSYQIYDDVFRESYLRYQDSDNFEKEVLNTSVSDDMRQEGITVTPENAARFVSSRAGWSQYVGSSSNFAFDLVQSYLMLGKVSKGVLGSLREGAKKTAAASATTASRISKKAAYLISEGTSEGFEEIVNYISEREAVNQFRIQAGREERKTNREHFNNYISDGHLWESFVLGSLGGVVMGGGARALNNYVESRKKNEDNPFVQTNKNAVTLQESMQEFVEIRNQANEMRLQKELSQEEADSIANGALFNTVLDTVVAHYSESPEMAQGLVDYHKSQEAKDALLRASKKDNPDISEEVINRRAEQNAELFEKVLNAVKQSVKEVSSEDKDVRKHQTVELIKSKAYTAYYETKIADKEANLQKKEIEDVAYSKKLQKNPDFKQKLEVRVLEELIEEAEVKVDLNSKSLEKTLEQRGYSYKKAKLSLETSEEYLKILKEQREELSEVTPLSSQAKVPSEIRDLEKSLVASKAMESVYANQASEKFIGESAEKHIKLLVEKTREEQKAALKKAFDSFVSENSEKTQKEFDAAANELLKDIMQNPLYSSEVTVEDMEGMISDMDNQIQEINKAKKMDGSGSREEIRKTINSDKLEEALNEAMYLARSEGNQAELEALLSSISKEALDSATERQKKIIKGLKEKGAGFMKTAYTFDKKKTAKEAPGGKDGAEEAPGGKDGAKEAPGGKDGAEEAPGGKEEAKEATGGKEEAKEATGGKEEAKEATGEEDGDAKDSNSEETNDGDEEKYPSEDIFDPLGGRNVIHKPGRNPRYEDQVLEGNAQRTTIEVPAPVEKEKVFVVEDEDMINDASIAKRGVMVTITVGPDGTLGDVYLKSGSNARLGSVEKDSVLHKNVKYLFDAGKIKSGDTLETLYKFNTSVRPRFTLINPTQSEYNNLSDFIPDDTEASVAETGITLLYKEHPEDPSSFTYLRKGEDGFTEVYNSGSEVQLSTEGAEHLDWASLSYGGLVAAMPYHAFGGTKVEGKSLGQHKMVPVVARKFNEQEQALITDLLLRTMLGEVPHRYTHRRLVPFLNFGNQVAFTGLREDEIQARGVAILTSSKEDTEQSLLHFTKKNGAVVIEKYTRPEFGTIHHKRLNGRENPFFSGLTDNGWTLAKGQTRSATFEEAVAEMKGIVSGMRYNTNRDYFLDETGDLNKLVDTEKGKKLIIADPINGYKDEKSSDGRVTKYGEVDGEVIAYPKLSHFLLQKRALELPFKPVVRKSDGKLMAPVNLHGTGAHSLADLPSEVNFVTTDAQGNKSRKGMTDLLEKSGVKMSLGIGTRKKIVVNHLKKNKLTPLVKLIEANKIYFNESNGGVISSEITPTKDGYRVSVTLPTEEYEAIRNGKATPLMQEHLMHEIGHALVYTLVSKGLSNGRKYEGAALLDAEAGKTSPDSSGGAKEMTDIERAERDLYVSVNLLINGLKKSPNISPWLANHLRSIVTENDVAEFVAHAFSSKKLFEELNAVPAVEGFSVSQVGSWWRSLVGSIRKFFTVQAENDTAMEQLVAILDSFSGETVSDLPTNVSKNKKSKPTKNTSSGSMDQPGVESVPDKKRNIADDYDDDVGTIMPGLSEKRKNKEAGRGKRRGYTPVKTENENTTSFVNKQQQLEEDAFEFVKSIMISSWTDFDLASFYEVWKKQKNNNASKLDDVTDERELELFSSLRPSIKNRLQKAIDFLKSEEEADQDEVDFYSGILDVVNSPYWSRVVSGVVKHLQNFNFFDSASDAITTGYTPDSKGFSDDTGKDAKETIPFEVKRVIASANLYDRFVWENGEVDFGFVYQGNSLLFAKTVPFDTTYNTIREIIHNASSVGDMMDRLESAVYAWPEVKGVLEILKEEGNSMLPPGLSEKDLPRIRRAFYSHFRQSKVPAISFGRGASDGEGRAWVEGVPSPVNRIISEINSKIRVWKPKEGDVLAKPKTSFLDIGKEVVPNKSIHTDITKQLSFEAKLIASDSLQTVAQFYEDMGVISISKRDLVSAYRRFLLSPDVETSEKVKHFQALDEMAKSIEEAAEKVNIQDNVALFLSSVTKNQPTKILSNDLVNNLVKSENPSFYNHKGNKKPLFTNPNTTYNTVDKLDNPRNLEKFHSELREDQFFKHTGVPSLFKKSTIKVFSNVDEKVKNFKPRFYEFNNYGFGDNVYGYDNIPKEELIHARYLAFKATPQGGDEGLFLPIPRADSSKNVMFSWKKNTLEVNEKNGEVTGSAVEEMMTQAEAELKRIRHYAQGMLKPVSDTNTNKKRPVYTQEVKDGLTVENEYDFLYEGDSFIDNQGRFTGRAFKAHYYTAANGALGQMKASQIANMPDSELAAIAKEAVDVRVNEMLQERDQVIKDLKTLPEVTKDPEENSVLSFVASDYIAQIYYMELFLGSAYEFKNRADMIKRAKDSGGTSFALSGKFSAVIVNDKIATLDSYGMMAENLANFYKEAPETPFAGMNFSVDNLAEGKKRNRLEERVYLDLGDPTEVVERTDAQGLVSMSKLRKQFTGLARDKDNILSVLDKIEKRPESVTAKEMSMVFTALKNVVHDRSIREVNPYIKDRVTHQLKSSDFPAVPFLFKGTPQEDVVDFMDVNGIDQVMFSSAQKVGAKNPVDISKLNKKVKAVDGTPTNENEVQKFRYSYDSQSHQVDFPESSKNSVTLSQQVINLATENIPLDSTLDVAGKSVVVSEAIQEMESILSDMSKKEMLKVLGDMGVDPESKKITDYNKLRIFLEDNVKSFGQGVYGEEFLETLREATDSDISGMRGTLSIGGLSNVVLPAIFAEISRRALDISLPGKELVEVTEYLLDGIEGSSTIARVGKGDLKVVKNKDGVVVHEVIVPSFGPFLGKSHEEVQSMLEEMHNNYEDNKDILEGIVYRTPSEGKKSTAIVKVVGLFPENTTKAFAGPKELVKQMGKDHDADKVKFLQRPGISGNKEQFYDVFKAFLTHTASQAERAIPTGSAALERAAAVAESLQKREESTLAPLSFSEQMRYATATQSVRNLKGVAVNYRKMSAIFQRIGYDMDLGISINGKKLRLDKPLAIDGSIITENSSSFVSAAMDALKKPVFPSLNVDSLEALELAAGLTLLGVDMETLGTLMADPDFVNGVLTAKMPIKGRPIDLKVNPGEPFEISDEEMRDSVYSKLLWTTKLISDLVSLAEGRSLEVSLEGYTRLVQRIGNVMQLSKRNSTKKYKMEFINSLYKEGSYDYYLVEELFGGAVNVSSQLAIDGWPQFVKILEEASYGRHWLQKDIAKVAKGMMLGSTDFFNNSFSKNQETPAYNSMDRVLGVGPFAKDPEVFEEMSVFEKHVYLQNKHKDTEGFDQSILRHAYVQEHISTKERVVSGGTEKKRYPLMLLNRVSSNVNESTLKDSIRSLYSMGTEEKSYVEDLIKYTWARFQLAGGKNSLATIIPTELYQKAGVIDAFRNLETGDVESLADTLPSSEALAFIYYANNPTKARSAERFWRNDFEVDINEQLFNAKDSKTGGVRRKLTAFLPTTAPSKGPAETGSYEEIPVVDIILFYEKERMLIRPVRATKGQMDVPGRGVMYATKMEYEEIIPRGKAGAYTDMWNRGNLMPINLNEETVRKEWRKDFNVEAPGGEYLPPMGYPGSGYAEAAGGFAEATDMNQFEEAPGGFEEAPGMDSYGFDEAPGEDTESGEGVSRGYSSILDLPMQVFAQEANQQPRTLQRGFSAVLGEDFERSYEEGSADTQADDEGSAVIGVTLGGILNNSVEAALSFKKTLEGKLAQEDIQSLGSVLSMVSEGNDKIALKRFIDFSSEVVPKMRKMLDYFGWNGEEAIKNNKEQVETDIRVILSVAKGIAEAYEHMGVINDVPDDYLFAVKATIEQVNEVRAQATEVYGAAMGLAQSLLQDEYKKTTTNPHVQENPELLADPTEDPSFLDAWLGAPANTTHPLMANAIAAMEYESRQRKAEAKAYQTKLFKKIDRLEQIGGSTDRLLGKKEDGSINGFFINKYKRFEYNKAVGEFRKKERALLEDYYIAENEKEMAEIQTKLTSMRNAWRKENLKELYTPEQIEAIRNEMLQKLENQEITQAEFSKWEAKNIYISDFSGEQEFIFRAKLTGDYAIPADKYLDSDFSKLMSEDTEEARILKDILQDMEEKMLDPLEGKNDSGENKGLGTRELPLPSVTNNNSKLPKYLQRETLDSFVGVLRGGGEMSVKNVIRDVLTGRAVKSLRPPFMSSLSSDPEKHLEMLETDLRYSIPQALNQMAEFEARKAHEDKILLTQEVMRNQAYFKRFGSNFKQKDIAKLFSKQKNTDVQEKKNSVAYREMANWVDAIFYGEFNDPKTHPMYHKTAEVLTNFTSLTSIAFNLFSATNNVMYGTIVSHIEGSGGVHFTSTEWAKAFAEFSKPDGLIMKVAAGTFSHKVPKSKLHAIIQFFDIVENQDERGKNSSAGKYLGAVQRVGYLPLTVGEFLLQNATLVAMLRSQKMYKGKVVRNVWEYKKEAGSNKNLKALKKEFNSLPSLYDTIEYKDGELDLGALKEHVGKISTQAVAVNQDIHGIYNREHANMFQRKALGKIAMQFHKWMYPGWRKRFGPKFMRTGEEAGWDERLATPQEGYYATAFAFLRHLFLNMKSLRTAWKDYLGNLSPHQMANMRKFWLEMLYMIGTYATYTVVKNMLDGDDDDENPDTLAGRRALFMVARLRTEVRAYFPLMWLSEAKNLTSNPLASWRTVDDIIQLGGQVFAHPFLNEEDRTYQGGQFVGKDKLGVRITKILPGYNQYYRHFVAEPPLRYYMD